MTRERNKVSALVSSWELGRVHGFIVEGLVDITNIVVQKSEGIRLGNVWVVREEPVLYVLVNVAVQIVISVISDA